MEDNIPIYLSLRSSLKKRCKYQCLVSSRCQKPVNSRRFAQFLHLIGKTAAYASVFVCKGAEMLSIHGFAANMEDASKLNTLPHGSIH